MSIAETNKAIEKYQRLVYGLALAYTRSKHDADDAFQETFLAFHRHSGKWADEEHCRAWLIRTAVNMSRRITCSIWRKRTVSMENAEDTAEQFCYETAEQNEIAEAVKELPEKYRMVIWLYYFEEMSVREISAAVGTGEGTVRSQLHRGREILRGQLKDYFDKEGDE